jgi:hypothetical protein
MFVRRRSVCPRIVMKKFTMTVNTTISTAIVDMTAPYCAYIGIGLQKKWWTPFSG